jgi:hypothetical protein
MELLVEPFCMSFLARLIERPLYLAIAEAVAHNGVQVGRVSSNCVNGCRLPKSVATPQIDAGPIYSNLPSFTNNVLREPNSCKLRTSAGNFPPVTTNPSGGRHFYLAGDARVDEHALLTNMHTIWLREHNRVCDEVKARQPSLSVEKQFELARNVRRPDPISHVLSVQVVTSANAIHGTNCPGTTLLAPHLWLTA